MTPRAAEYANAAVLALASVVHNRRLSVFTVTIYAAVVAPAIIIYLLKSGVISAWTEDLSKDVQSREIKIAGEYPKRLTADEMARLRGQPGVDFVVGEAMAIVTTRQMRRIAPERGPVREIKIRTTDAGDPVLPNGFALTGADVVLSKRAADRLMAVTGDTVAFTLRRQLLSGEVETHRLPFTVVHVVDPRKWHGEVALLLPDVAVAMADWIASDLKDVSYIQTASAGSTSGFASFRVYARSVHDAPSVLNALVKDSYDASLRVSDVARMKFLERGLNMVFGVLLTMSAIGLVASVLLLQWLSVERQSQDLALLLAAGYGQNRIRAFVLGQAGILSFLGLAVAVVIAGTAFLNLAPIVLRQVDLAENSVHWPPLWLGIGSFVSALLMFIGVAWIVAGRLQTTALLAALRSD